MKKLIQNKEKIVAAIFALIYLYIASYLMMRGSGSGKGATNVILMCILIIFLNSSKKAFYLLVVPYSILISLYTPFGLNFGALRYEYLASIFSTNFTEGSKMLNSTPTKHFLYAFCIIPSLIIFRFLTTKFDIQFYKNKTLICICLIFAMSNLAPLNFLKNSYNSIIKIKSELITSESTNEN